MGVSTVGKGAAGPRRSQDWVRGSLVGFALGVGLCTAFGVFEATRDRTKVVPLGAQTGATRARPDTGCECASAAQYPAPRPSRKPGTRQHPSRRRVFRTTAIRRWPRGRRVHRRQRQQRATRLHRARSLRSGPAPSRGPGPVHSSEKTLVRARGARDRRTRVVRKQPDAFCAVNRSLNTAHSPGQNRPRKPPSRPSAKGSSSS